MDLGVLCSFLLFPVLILMAFAYVQQAEHDRFMAQQDTCRESGGTIVPTGRQQWHCRGTAGETLEIDRPAGS